MKFTCDTNVLVDVLRDPSAEEAFGVFLSRFSHLTYLSAVVILEAQKLEGDGVALERRVSASPVGFDGRGDVGI